MGLKQRGDYRGRGNRLRKARRRECIPAVARPQAQPQMNRARGADPAASIRGGQTRRAVPPAQSKHADIISSDHSLHGSDQREAYFGEGH